MEINIQVFICVVLDLFAKEFQTSVDVMNMGYSKTG
jgi:hypothetical protein